VRRKIAESNRQLVLDAIGSTWMRRNALAHLINNANTLNKILGALVRDKLIERRLVGQQMYEYRKCGSKQ
jgi:hypothetical protein